jgi:WD40 repeat protein
MIKPHAGFPATLLRDGRVLVGDTDGAEVYDPDSGTWAATGRMVKADPGTATLLRDGRVLVTGSFGTSSQVYDPLNGMWASTGKMVTPRVGHAATLQPDGKVLVVGGHDGGFENFASAELYDPATGTWTAIAPMDTAKASITATLLPDGKVLVVGSTPRQTTPPELYDTATGTWTVIGDHPASTFDRSATLLSDGTVLLTDAPDATLYDPVTGSWIPTGTMHAARRFSQTSTLLLDGTVLVAGGFECSPAEMEGDREVHPEECSASSSTELYVPAGISPPSAVLALPSSATTPIPTPSPTPIPPAVGPVPPGARTWTVKVVNMSSQPAALFVADEDDQGGMAQLVGSATPNIVPAGATVRVTFAIPAKGVEGWSIYVNPGPDDGGLVGWDNLPADVEIHINEFGIPTYGSRP